MNVNRRRVLLAGVSVAALGATQAHAQAKVIAVGVSLPLTGPGAATGITTQRTLEHGVELINAEGIQIGPDRYTLKLSFYDNKYVPAEAVTIVEKMLADGTRFLISLGSGNSVPVVAKTTAVKALQMSVCLGQGAPHRTRISVELPRRTDQRDRLCGVSLAARDLQGREEDRPHESPPTRPGSPSPKTAG